MTSLDEYIVQLVDMGFTAEQARKALRASNNNVENAISYLFEDHIEISDSEPDKATGAIAQDTVAISNPLDIPNFSDFSNTERQREIEDSDMEATTNSSSSMASSGVSTKVDVQHEAHEAIAADQHYQHQQQQYYQNEREFGEEDEYEDEDVGYPVESEYAPIVDDLDKLDIATIETSKDVKLVLPKIPSTKYQSVEIENEFIPFLIILSQLNKFQEVLFADTFQYKDYGWDSSWYNVSSKSKELNILLPTDIPSSKAKSFRLIVEIQRLVGFLNSSISNRQIISSFNLLNAIKDVKPLGDDFDEDLSIEELVPKIYECIGTSLKTLNGDLSESIESLFKSVVYSENDEDEDLDEDEEHLEEEAKTNNIYHLDIENNHRHRNIYDSFNELIWGLELDQLGKIYFTKFSDVLSITRLGNISNWGDMDDSQVGRNHFDIIESFYPQIYTKKYKDVILGMNKERESINKERHANVNQFNKLTFFEGKKLNSILEKSSNYFKNIDKETSSNLEYIYNQNDKKRQEINKNVEGLILKSKKFDVLNYENILDNIKKQEEIPYDLIGIVSKLNHYYYRIRGSLKWIEIRISICGGEEELETNVFKDFDELKQTTRINTSATTSFIYVKRDVLQSENVSKIPHGLEIFFDRDNKLYDQWLQDKVKEKIEQNEHTEDINDDEGNSLEQDRENAIGDVGLQQQQQQKLQEEQQPHQKQQRDKVEHGEQEFTIKHSKTSQF